MKQSLLLLPLMTGCIVIEGEKSTWDDWDTGYGYYDYDYDYYDTAEDDTAEDDTDGTEDTTSTEDTSDTQEPFDGTFYLVPNKAAPGDVFIASLRSDQSMNWADIVSITPYGELSICSTQPLFDELLLTIQVNSDAVEGTVDLVVEYSSGDVDLIEDGIIIALDADVGNAATSSTACE